jgi:hypothetical protein
MCRVRFFLRTSVLLLAACCAVDSHGQPATVSDPAYSKVSYEAPKDSSEAWQLGADPFQIERGKPIAIIDGVGWVLTIPEKLLLWNSKVLNHSVSSQTETEIAQYMSVNNLNSVKVRINQYAPLDEWKRLRRNKKVGAGWRYTLGMLSTLGYTILPGRIFGTDYYNPYTNTIYIYSDVSALALEQAAYAKDVRSRKHPGTYAAGKIVPFWGLKHEQRSKQEVHNYLARSGLKEQQAAAQKVLQPQMGLETGTQIGAFVPPLQFAFQATGAAVGHVVGRHKARRYEE